MTENTLPLPGISVIVPTLNQDRFLGAALDSILSQHYPDLEVIVVDGGSRDRTVEILKGYGDKIRWVSEPDRGQSDAVNKGFAMARKEIAGWLNSDDLYEPHALSIAGKFFSGHPETMWAFGDCSIVNESGKEIRRWVSQYKSFFLKHYRYDSLLIENFISQMSVFMRRDIFLQAGGCNIELHYSMDYDLWLRLGKLHRPEFIPQRLAKFRMYGNTKSMSGFDEQLAEDLLLVKKYAADRPDILFLHRLNALKILWAYKFMAFFRHFARRNHA